MRWLELAPSAGLWSDVAVKHACSVVGSATLFELAEAAEAEGELLRAGRLMAMAVLNQTRGVDSYGDNHFFSMHDHLQREGDPTADRGAEPPGQGSGGVFPFAVCSRAAGIPPLYWVT